MRIPTALCLFAFVTTALACSIEDSTSDTSYDKKLEAWVMTQEFVEDKLKSPGTANYGGIFDGQHTDNVVTDLGNDRYLVRAWVDSQNSFGATLRTYFVCELKHDDGTWRRISLVFGERPPAWTEAPDPGELPSYQIDDGKQVEGPTEGTDDDAGEAAQADTPQPSRKRRPIRNWTSTADTTLTARIVSRSGDKVKLETEDGRVLTVNFDQLSKADQDYIEGLMK